MECKKETKSFIEPRPPSIDRRFRPRPHTKLNLFELIKEGRIDEDESERSQSSNDYESTKSELSVGLSEISSMGNSYKQDEESALVYLRIRPVEKPSERYTINEKELVTTYTETNTANVQNSFEKHFVFNHIFDEKVTQSDLYQKCIKDKIEAENNFTVMTYGTSGSGKTYTLLGTSEEPGILPRAFENIFKKYSENLYTLPSVLLRNGEIIFSNDDYFRECKHLRRTLLDSSSELKKEYETSRTNIFNEDYFEVQAKDNESVLIYCSFVEIYNEVVHDLLNVQNTQNFISSNGTLNKKTGLKIMMNDGKSFIKDVTSVLVNSSYEAYQLLWKGLKKVTYASTNINNNSSRSHCIFVIDIIKYNEPDIFTHISYKFCDLAGSERLGKTGNKGTRLKEAQQINKSLMVLGRCLDAAYHNQTRKHPDIIPYRESKLTMLLQAALQGKEKITMIVNITPSEEYFEENTNVLTFSSIARNIVYKNIEEKRNTTRFSWISHAVSDQRFENLWEENCTLRSEIENLSSTIERLEKRLVQQEIDLRNTLVNHYEAQEQRTKQKWQEQVRNTELSTKKYFEHKIESLQKNYERKIERLQDEIENLEEELSKYEKQAHVQSDEENKNLSNSAKKRRTLEKIDLD